MTDSAWSKVVTGITWMRPWAVRRASLKLSPAGTRKVSAPALMAPIVFDVGRGGHGGGGGGGVGGAVVFVVPPADLVPAAGQVELAGDRDLVSSQQVAAAQ